MVNKSTPSQARRCKPAKIKRLSICSRDAMIYACYPPSYAGYSTSPAITMNKTTKYKGPKFSHKSDLTHVSKGGKLLGYLTYDPSESWRGLFLTSIGGDELYPQECDKYHGWGYVWTDEDMAILLHSKQKNAELNKSRGSRMSVPCLPPNDMIMAPPPMVCPIPAIMPLAPVPAPPQGMAPPAISKVSFGVRKSVCSDAGQKKLRSAAPRQSISALPQSYPFPPVPRQSVSAPPQSCPYTPVPRQSISAPPRSCPYTPVPRQSISAPPQPCPYPPMPRQSLAVPLQAGPPFPPVIPLPAATPYPGPRYYHADPQCPGPRFYHLDPQCPGPPLYQGPPPQLCPVRSMPPAPSVTKLPTTDACNQTCTDISTTDRAVDATKRTLKLAESAESLCERKRKANIPDQKNKEEQIPVIQEGCPIEDGPCSIQDAKMNKRYLAFLKETNQPAQRGYIDQNNPAVTTKVVQIEPQLRSISTQCDYISLGGSPSKSLISALPPNTSRVVVLKRSPPTMSPPKEPAGGKNKSTIENLSPEKSKDERKLSAEIIDEESRIRKWYFEGFRQPAQKNHPCTIS